MKKEFFGWAADMPKIRVLNCQTDYPAVEEVGFVSIRDSVRAFCSGRCFSEE